MPIFFAFAAAADTPAIRALMLMPPIADAAIPSPLAAFAVFTTLRHADTPVAMIISSSPLRARGA